MARQRCVGRFGPRVGVAMLLGLVATLIAVSACGEQARPPERTPWWATATRPAKGGGEIRPPLQEIPSPTPSRQFEGTELPFETIEEHSPGAYFDTRYLEGEHGLIILADREDLGALDGLRFQQARSLLEALDYDAYFAVVALKGRRGNIEDAIHIERITRNAAVVTVHVTEYEPKDGMAAHPIALPKAHVVRIRKVGTWGEMITFYLVTDQGIMASAEHFVP